MCQECKYTWFACSKCIATCSSFCSDKALYEHLYDFHKEIIINLKKRKCSLGTISEDIKLSFKTNILEATIDQGLYYVDVYCRFKKQYKITAEKFYHQMNLNNLGNQYLVVKSNFGIKYVDVMNNFPHEEMLLQLEIARFVSQLTKDERSSFVLILNKVEHNIIKKYSNNTYY